MIVVNSFFACEGCTLIEESFNDIIHKLANEMLECHFAARHQRALGAFNGFESPTIGRQSNVIHLAPQKKPHPNPATPDGREKMISPVAVVVSGLWKEEDSLVLQWLQQ